jgi:alkanesulfonate monooxygenase SsuD/methylene tetrahydromethanopterin reductase-like flavin-dependent oxidoreductase (luciferase family)
MLREYLEAMRALWTQEEASYDGEFVSFGPSWAWPKPVQSHIPVLVGAAGTEKNFGWIARSADGWITTPRDLDIDEPVKLLQDTWATAGRDGAPQIVALDFKPDPDKLARWAELGVTEVLFGLPDRTEDEIAAYVERLAGKLSAIGSFTPEAAPQA